MKIKFICFLSTIILMALIAGCTSNNSKEKLKKREDKPMFERIVIEETVMGNGLYLNDIKQYGEFLEDTAIPFEENEVNKFLSAINPKSKYYPILELIYKTPEISVFLIAEKGLEKSGFYVITTKSGNKVAEIDLWESCGFDSFDELNEKIILDNRVSAGENYYFTVFGNNYNIGYYWVEISLSGKIEVKKVMVPEGEAP